MKAGPCWETTECSALWNSGSFWLRPNEAAPIRVLGTDRNPFITSLQITRPSNVRWGLWCSNRVIVSEVLSSNLFFSVQPFFLRQPLKLIRTNTGQEQLVADGSEQTYCLIVSPWAWVITFYHPKMSQSISSWSQSQRLPTTLCVS